MNACMCTEAKCMPIYKPYACRVSVSNSRHLPPKRVAGVPHSVQPFHAGTYILIDPDVQGGCRQDTEGGGIAVHVESIQNGSA